ncbi:unnamed protein product, partial [Adineta steineri]
MAKIDPYYLAFDSSQPCQYYQPSNAINSTEVDYSGQAQQYQNTLTLGITFFNLSSIFIGILADMFGGRFVKLII